MTEKGKVDSLLTDNRTAIKEKYLNDLIQEAVQIRRQSCWGSGWTSPGLPC